MEGGSCSDGGALEEKGIFYIIVPMRTGLFNSIVNSCALGMVYLLCSPSIARVF